ncbi:ATP-binding protein [Streptomyces sp. NBS 14/10]|uniref:ATP-binding protein n=1 Tax=Streptomyces sp. NBS 14/10 TaxID=1945643 RepID=UPI000B7D54C5|nr:ATP-binding protein [Streptomyces sp. NBS 14/10]KAK1176683.1 ATP-binding protein [Streptomyces sp. NBS 14/10]
MAPWPRRLVVVAVDEYFTEDEAFTAGIQKQVETITGWLADPAMDEERRFELARPKELTQPEDLRLFLTEQELAQAQWDQALVVYITGHGLRGQSRRHYLTFGHTAPDRLLGTAFPTSELITQVMDSEAEHVLVLVDSCFAGSLKSELGVLFEELCAQRRDLKTLAVVTSGDFEQEPHRGEFTRLLKLALDKARDESAGFTAPHLSFEEWEKLLNTVGDENPGLLRALWVWPDSRRHEPSLCLPNPHYQPQEQVVEASRQPVSLSASTLEQYWLARASGRTDDDDPGWYFSGRQTLMQALVEFVHAGSGVLVVTGAAGSGKSALLARLVTLSDPLFISRFEDMIETVPTPLRPRPHAVDAAVLARGKPSLALIEDLLAALGVEGTGGELPLQALLDQVAAACADASEPVTLVVDGLDEAQEPTACLSDVIAPLARLRATNGEPAVRLVLGMRSSAQHAEGGKLQDVAADQLLGFLHTVLQAGMGESSVPLDLLRTDGAQTLDDITAYVEMVLQANESSPYAGHDAAAAGVAAVIAQAVTPSFLDARLAATQLRSASGWQDVHDPLWHDRLQAGTTALLSNDLRQVARDQEISLRLLLAVLRATAFAQGAGLPWAEVWPAVAAAILGPAAPPASEIDAVIRTVRHSRLVGYLAIGEEDGRVTYRPAHQRVAEVLLSEPQSLLTIEPHRGAVILDAPAGGALRAQDEVHRSIAETCAQLARAADPLAPHPYVRRHTAAHAQAGHVLDDAVMPLSLAARETSGTLRTRLGIPLPVDDPSRRVLTAAGLIEPYIDDSTDVASREASIQFQLAALTRHGLPDDAGVPQPAEAWEEAPALTPTAVFWMPGGNVVGFPSGGVHALCTWNASDGRGLIAAGTRHGIGVWDSSGHKLVQISCRSIYDLTVLRANSGRGFLAAATAEGAGVFDPLSGQRLAWMPLPDAREVRVLREGANRWLLAVVTSREMVTWAPSEQTHERVHLPKGHLLFSRGAWVRDAAGEHWRFFRQAEGTPLLFNPCTEQTWPVTLKPTTVRSLAGVTGPGGGDVLAVVRKTHQVDLLDPFSGTLLARDFTAGGKALGIPLPNDRTLLGIWNSETISVWDASGQRPQRVSHFPARTVLDVAGVYAQDETLALAATGDEGILLHKGDAPDFSADLRMLAVTKPGMAVARTADDYQMVAIAQRMSLTLVDSANHRPLFRLGTRGPVGFLEVVPGQGEAPALIFGQRHGAGYQHSRICLWEPQYDTVQHLATGFDYRASLTVQLPDGQMCLVLAHSRGVDALWLQSGQLTTLAEHLPVTRLLVLPSPADQCLVAGLERGKVTVWDLITGQIVHEAVLRAARNAVRAACVVPARNAPWAVAIATSRGVTLWDPNSWQQISQFELPSTNAMLPLPMDSGATVLATATATGLHLWDPRAGRLLRSLITAASVTSVVHTTTAGHRLHIGGPAGLAALTWSPNAHFD